MVTQEESHGNFPPTGLDRPLVRDLPRKSMAWKLEFAPGAGQALHAGHYFNAVANDLVDEVLTGMCPHHYRFEPADAPHLALRIWAYEQPSDATVADVLHLMQAARRDMLALLRRNAPMERIADFFKRWLGAQWATCTLFVEKLHAREAFSPGERLDLSLAVLGGQLHMLSTGTAMFIRHAPGTYGLALAGRGSYLLEEVQAHEPMHKKVGKS